MTTWKKIPTMIDFYFKMMSNDYDQIFIIILDNKIKLLLMA